MVEGLAISFRGWGDLIPSEKVTTVHGYHLQIDKLVIQRTNIGGETKKQGFHGQQANMVSKSNNIVFKQQDLGSKHEGLSSKNGDS